MKTIRDIVDEANAMARDFYKLQGCEVPEGYRFDRATHPLERLMWRQAAVAYERLCATDLEDVVAELEER